MSEKRTNLPIPDERLNQFERNNYFYGKLMTASDFESEQQYFNEKRYLINRLMHGNGIVCGLQVSLYDHKSLSVVLSSGVALDCHGQEIIVSKKHESYLISTQNLNPNTLTEQQSGWIGLFIKRKDEGKESVPSPSLEFNEQICTNNKIQENFELYFDILQDKPNILSSFSEKESSDISLEKSQNTAMQEYDELSREECPSCGGKESGVIIAALKKSSSGWDLDPVETIQRRKTVKSWFNDISERNLNQTGELKQHSTSGIVELEYSAGTNILFGPIEHYLNNVTSPPLITLGKAADNSNVEYIEDYGLCENKTPSICFKAVNINLKNFMIRLDAKSAGHLNLRWWATLTKDTGWQKVKPLVRPAVIFSSPKYSVDDLVTITVTDPQVDKSKQVDYVSVKISSKTNPQGIVAEAKEIGPNSGVFNAQVSLVDVVRKTPDTLVASYTYTIQGRPETITATAEITEPQKPKISFSAKSYTLYDVATVRIIDNTKGPSDVLSVQINSKKNPTPIHLDAPYVITSNLFGVLFNAKINVVTVTKAVPDTLVVSYTFRSGNEIKTLTATAEVIETR